MTKNLVAHRQFRLVMQTHQWMPSLADPRPPAPPRYHNEQATRRSGDGLRLSIGDTPCSVRSRDTVVILPEIVPLL